MRSLEQTLTQSDWWLHKKRKLGHKDKLRKTGRRWPSISPGDGPQKGPALLTPWSQTSSLSICETINFYCLRHPVYGTFYSSPSKLIYQTWKQVGRGAVVSGGCPEGHHWLCLAVSQLFQFVPSSTQPDPKHQKARGPFDKFEENRNFGRSSISRWDF